ncbi:TonB-dependent receptor [Novispirillum itersonii]|uniref:Iron complex outermembrane receptor protein n=1 Tax=Novispirillum itersonii TaxID=189 RepID=A0A7W9ZKY6_NOVIT|nr:TonB-dependent receptor [Novispirillum itersonii]MBB6212139.1 iron complex outermembrane receptor protein [Novispirillum itersonii]
MVRLSMRGALVLSASLGPLLMMPVRAAAQTAPAQPGSVTLAPLTVEARQWKEDEQDLPASVSVLRGDTLGTPLWDSLAAVAKVTPNVQIEQSTVQSRVVIRGMTAANTALQDPVGYFVNDVALPHGASQAPRLFDTASMEVLKGPQGTLYGRNTEAGAIKVITGEPSRTLRAQAEASVGFRDGATGWSPTTVASGQVSGPVTGDVAASLAVRGETTDGVHRNRWDGSSTGGDLDRWTLSGGVSAFVGDDTEVTLKSVVERGEQGKQRMRYITGAFTTPRYETNYNTESWDRTLTAVQSAKVVHQAGDLELTSVTGWTHYSRDFLMDLDGWSVQALRNTLSHTDDAVSQELRLATADPQARVRWLGGLYTFREWTDLEFTTGTAATRRTTTIDQTGAAAFGQVEIGLTDRLRAGLGSRVEWLGQDGHQTYATATGRTTFDGSRDSVTLLPRASLSFDVTDSSLLYGSYARGYLPGGYNYGSAGTAEGFTYDAESSWTAEVGLKNRFWEDRLNTRLALFHTTTRDKQIFDLVPGGTQRVSNAARAEIYGMEASAEARLDGNWSVFASGGWQHAEATEYRAMVQQGAALVSTDLSGRTLPMAASVTYGLGVRYDAEAGWFGQASLNGSGPFYFDSLNVARQGASLLADAEIGYRFAGVDVALWGSNLFDENVYSRAAATPVGIIAEDGDGRELGLRIKAYW